MSTVELTPKEQANKRKGMIISITIHAIIIILAILPFLKYPDPPPGQEGVLIAFGETEAGQGNDLPETQQEDPDITENRENAEAKPTEQAASKPQAEKVLTSEDSDARLKQQQADADKKKKSEAQKIADLEAARKKAAEDAAQKAAAAEAQKKADAEKAKKQYNDLFGGKGQGDTDKSGNQGLPAGSVESKNLTGGAQGAGVIGAGLSNRGLKKSSPITDKSQKTGRVVVTVCVDRMGNVIKTEYTQRGSTTTDGQLISLARKNAQSYKFTESDIDEQCGTITYDFKLQ
jgi:membrane protein involved in colicin uptake